MNSGLRLAMEIDFTDPIYRRLEADATFNAGLHPTVVRAFRKKLFFLRNALDERDIYEMRSLRYEKLKGDRLGQSSIRLNDQWRLILKIVTKENGKVVLVISVEDYH